MQRYNFNLLCSLAKVSESVYAVARWKQVYNHAVVPASLSGTTAVSPLAPGLGICGREKNT